MRFILATVLATSALARSYNLDHHQHVDRQDRRAVVNVDPPIACVCPVVTAELQPVFFTQYVPETTVIYPFPGGDPLHVTRAPTYISLTSTVTHRITSCPVSTGASVSTPSPVASSTSSISTATNQLSFGQGLPQGSVNNLDDTIFIFLAYRDARTFAPVAKRDHENVRRQATYSTSPVRAVDLAQPTDALGTIGQDNCDNATPLLLREGRLIYYNNAVAKQLREDPAILGFLSPQPVNEVNTTFGLIDGNLRWVAADFQTNAAFYICGDRIYAAWETPVVPSCTPIIVGAIAGSACIQRVQQSRAPNPAFVAPIPSSTTTLGASPSPSQSPSLSSLGTSASSAAGGATMTLSTMSSPFSSTDQPSSQSVSAQSSSIVSSPASSTSVSTAVSSGTTISLISQSSVTMTPSSSPSVASTSTASTSTNLMTSSNAATNISSPSSSAASSNSTTSTSTTSNSTTLVSSSSSSTTTPSTSTTTTTTTTSSSSTQSPTFSNPCQPGTYYLFSTTFGKFATPNTGDNFTYTLFDANDNSNALTVQFVFNATTNNCQLNLAGSDRTIGIQTGNPNPQAALFIFIDNFRLGDINSINGAYFPITCTTNAALQLSCFVTMYPNLDSLQVQGNTTPQNYLAIVPDQMFNNYTPANVVLIPV